MPPRGWCQLLTVMWIPGCSTRCAGSQMQPGWRCPGLLPSSLVREQTSQRTWSGLPLSALWPNTRRTMAPAWFTPMISSYLHATAKHKILHLHKLTHHLVSFRATKSISCHTYPRCHACRFIWFSFNWKGEERVSGVEEGATWSYTPWWLVHELFAYPSQKLVLGS